MVAGKLPFSKATMDDKVYTSIRNNRPDFFWMIHSRKTTFSEDFKNFVASLLAFDPIHRLSISEIKNHPWYTQPVPDIDQIEEEFKKRRLQLSDIRLEGREEETILGVDSSDEEEKQPEPDADPNALADGRTHEEEKTEANHQQIPDPPKHPHIS